jgi:hypothetical protein
MRILSAIGFVPLASLIAINACTRGASSGFSPLEGDASAPDAGAVGYDANLFGDGNANGHPCHGLGCQVVDCAAQGLPNTSVTGTVYDPAGQNPLYDVIVYVPNAPVQPLPSGVTCDQCGVLASGDPVVTALTGPDGKFRLDNVPVVPNLPLVIQLGKWRRQLVLPQVIACTENFAGNPSQTRLPSKRSEGDMPQIAVATGGCDPFECLLRKIGIDASEFTNENGGGHVHLYQGTGGAALAQPTTQAATFWAGNTLTRYDIVVNACECGEQPQEKPQSSIDNLVAYANAGGRVFNTHYHYYWIDPTKITSMPPMANNVAWQSTANFIPEVTGSSDLYGYVDTTFPKGQAFARWLYDVGASVNEGSFMVEQARYNVTDVRAPSTRWVFNPNTGQTQTLQPALFHYTFNTPVGQPEGQQCGKVLFSDFHVVASTSTSTTFPGECDASPMTAQEKALEFMFFDLSACIQQDQQPPQPPPPAK